MWSKKQRLALLFCFMSTVALILVGGFGTLAPAQEKGAITIGFMYDTTGPTQLFGIPISQAGRDLINLTNRKGGIAGHPINALEHEMGYKVPLAVEAYERFKAAGAVYTPAWGTPIVYALTERATNDKIPITSPGFGRADAADGTRFPYVFPIAASYWSQAGASIKYVLDQWKAEGKSGMPKIAYLYWDNPAGREPFPIFNRLQKKLGFKFKSWGIPSPGIEQSAQILDITRRYKADWVILHTWSKSPAIAMKELHRNGFPLDHVIGFVWACSEHDLVGAGPKVAEGYQCLRFAGVGFDYSVIREIKKMYADENKPAPREMLEISSAYNQGIVWMGVPLEAIRLAVEKYGYPVTGEQVKNGFEMIKGFTLGGIVPPLEITPHDHEGGGWTQLAKVKNGTFIKGSDWFHGFRDEVMKQLAEAAKAGD